MGKVLIVEDSRLYARLLQTTIIRETKHNVIVAQSYGEAEEIFKKQNDFDVALADLNLPDAPDGEIVDFLREKNIPVIVFTGLLDDDIRDKIISKGVSEYVVKHGQQEVDYVVDLLRKLISNRSMKVMVVDDSSLSRKEISRILKNQNFDVIEFSNPIEALTYLRENQEIDLIIVDEEMPAMSGVQFILEARKLRPRLQMGIIGISGYGSGYLSAKMLKAGADDFIHKPFLYEEFVCRVNNTVEMIRSIKTARDASLKDYLTGLYNRRYFFEVLPTYMANVKRDNFSLALGILDIDNFKLINDTYGHDTGDLVLAEIGRKLGESCRKGDLLFRFGGEEFVIVAINLSQKEALSFFNRVRSSIQATTFNSKESKFSVTVSIGVSFVSKSQYKTIKELLNEADSKLYQAKRTGKNKVVI